MSCEALALHVCGEISASGLGLSVGLELMFKEDLI